MRRRFKWIVLVLCAFIVFVFIGLVPPSKRVSFADGTKADIRSAAIWRRMFPEANAKISYAPNIGQPGAVVLWQDLFDGPAVMFQGKQQGIVFCLYDFDVYYQLLRIDTSKPFGGVDTNSPLSRILFTSSWQIQEADFDDWQEALAYLRTAPKAQFNQSSVSVGLSTFRSQKNILDLLAYQHVK